MIFGSVCSGIEAASCAWHPLGWEAAFVSEIEPFPCSVLKQHYPDVPNHGDMTKFKEWPDARINVLVGGTPCQSFSVAGLRKGLADPRGNLMLTYLAIADRYRPEWVVWENVPGVLSSNGGRDFASFLRGLAELGYGFAYRILDAQYFGVAQRRRRVFVVGHIGDWRRAAAVLFERHSLQGNPAPRREAGKRTAASLVSGSKNSGGIGMDNQALFSQKGDNLVRWPADIVPAIDTTMKKYQGLDNQHINGGGDGLSQVSRTLNAGSMGRQDWETETLIPTNGGGFDVAHFLTRRYDSSEDGTGRGTPLVPIQNALRGKSQNGLGIGEGGEPMYTLDKAGQHAIAFDLAQITSKANRTRVEEGLPASTLNAAGQMHTAINIYGGNKRPDRPKGGFYVKEEATSKTLDSASGLNPSAAQGGTAVIAPSLTAFNMDSRSPQSEEQQRIVGAVYKTSMQVRRLTPRECERLQGFPDDYTLIQHRNKPAADGPRYKALGNSMAVPVMAWIGRRIAMVEQLKGDSPHD